MAALVAEHRHHQIGRAIHDRWEGDEVILRRYETAESHDAPHTVQRAERLPGLCQNHHRGKMRRQLRLLRRHGDADLANMARRELAVEAEAELTGDDEERPCLHRGDIVSERGADGGKFDAEFGKTGINAHDRLQTFAAACD